MAEQDAAATLPDLATLSAGFAARLRAAGVPATPERSARFAATVELARPESVRRLYWLARVTLVDQHTQLSAFDHVFAQFFMGMADVAEHRGPTPQPAVPHLRPGPRARPRVGARRGDTDIPAPSATPMPSHETDRQAAAAVLMTASVEERLGHKDFADFTAEEMEVLRALVSALRVAAPRRRSRRTEGAPSGRRLNVRRTLRRAHRTGGDPVRREYRRRRTRPRRIVLLADVSGSMESYSRVYLQLLQGAVRGARAEAFVLATRLTRVTRVLASGPAEVAAARAAEAAPDWSGGTRIGESMRTFLNRYGRRGMARGAVVVIVSDGWERADPALLAEQMARLRRLAHRVIWVNPRAAAEEYEPLAGGMAAALPHVDVLVSGHSLRALADVRDAIAADSLPTGSPTVRANSTGSAVLTRSRPR
ncbi:MAG: vWA domain-containing protein [Nocardioidaceae bacterium]